MVRILVEAEDAIVGKRNLNKVVNVLKKTGLTDVHINESSDIAFGWTYDVEARTPDEFVSTKQKLNAFIDFVFKDLGLRTSEEEMLAKRLGYSKKDFEEKKRSNGRLWYLFI